MRGINIDMYIINVGSAQTTSIYVLNILDWGIFTHTEGGPPLYYVWEHLQMNAHSKCHLVVLKRIQWILAMECLPDWLERAGANICRYLQMSGKLSHTLPPYNYSISTWNITQFDRNYFIPDQKLFYFRPNNMSSLLKNYFITDQR